MECLTQHDLLQTCLERMGSQLGSSENQASHTDRMRRLMAALKTKAGDGLVLDQYASLIDRTLVFYYGYYIDPWRLIGSLYATEEMAHHRIKMGAGLKRLGLDPWDLEFIRVHTVCDEDHTRDWREGVILPSVRLNPGLREKIAARISSCLETSIRLSR